MKERNTSMLEGSIWKNLLKFAFPLFLGNLFQQLYNTVDALIVGHFMDESALAAVTSSGSLIFMLVGFFGGVSAGAGVVIAKHFGAKETDRMKKVMHTAVATGVIVGIFLTIFGILTTPTILKWMDTPDNVLPNSVSYFRVYFLGAIFMVMYNVAVSILQATGDSKHPLYYLITSSITNIILDLLFVGVFKWGVWSAAFATTIAQGVSVCLAYRRLLNVDSPAKIFIKDIKIDKESLKDIIRFGLPSGIQNSIIAVANVVVQSNINGFGDFAMAGCGSYFKVEGFAFLPITCFSMAISTFVGQNLGAKKYDRVKKGALLGIICSVILAEVVGLLIYLFAPQLISMFNDNPEVISFGVRQARTESLFYCVLAFSHCAAGVMRGSGNAKVPMYTMLAAWCIIRIIYVTVMLNFFPNIETIFTAYPVTWSISTLIFGFCLLKTDWIHRFEKLDANKTN